MIIEFLGTGAADWYGPTLEGEYRRFTSTLLDGALLIDGTGSIRDRLDKIRNVPAMLFTHSHSDHYSPEFLRQIDPGEAYASETWAAKAGLRPLSVGKKADIAGFEVIPMPANHSTEDPDETPLIYIIRKNGVTLLYATDGAWLTNRAYHLIREFGPLTAAVFDGTVGDDHAYDFRVFEHNTLPMVRTMREAMEKNGLLLPDSPVIVTHLARTLHPTQKVLEERESKHEKTLYIARDGMEMELYHGNSSF